MGGWGLGKKKLKGTRKAPSQVTSSCHAGLPAGIRPHPLGLAVSTPPLPHSGVPPLCGCRGGGAPSSALLCFALIINMPFSTFEQFSILRIVPIHPFGNLDLSFTNSSMFILIATILIISLHKIEGRLIPGR